MESDPAQVIRALRQALEMSQGEFARVLGWAPSTISRWERGQSPPSRLALKTILAFAEERGVRYRSKAQTKAPARIEHQPAEQPDGDSSTIPLLEYAVQPSSERPRMSEPPPYSGTSTSSSAARQLLSMTADRPRWSAEASIRLSADRQPVGSPRRFRTALNSASIMAASFCVMLAIGLPRSDQQVPPLPGTPKPPVIDPLKTSTPAPSYEEFVDQRPFSDGLAPEATDQYTAGDRSSHAPELAQMSAPAARLESIVIIGNTHRATFRTEAESLTVTEGSWLGDQQVALISIDRVELVSSAGETQTVRVGSPTSLE